MQNEIQVFDSEQSGSIRTVIQNGEPWFTDKAGWQITTQSGKDQGKREIRTPGGNL